MKRTNLFLLGLTSLMMLAWAPAQAQIAVSIGQPGFYGRIDIGNQVQPPLLFPDAIMGNPGIYTGAPIYMHVPPEHAYHWSRYCNLYGACDWMVYFVLNDWYEGVYVPGYRSRIYAPPPVYAAPPVYVPIRPWPARPVYGPPPHYRASPYYPGYPTRRDVHPPRPLNGAGQPGQAPPGQRAPGDFHGHGSHGGGWSR